MPKSKFITSTELPHSRKSINANFYPTFQYYKRFNVILTLFMMIITIIPPIHGQAPEWAPIGATWTYRLIGPDRTNNDRLELESIGDTLIQDKSCRILRERYDRDFDGQLDSIRTYYVHQSGDTIWYYIEGTGKFSLLYDFSSNNDDTLIIFEPYEFSLDSTISLVVSAVGTPDSLVPGLRSYLMTDLRPIGSFDSPWFFHGQAVEKLGDIDIYFFPINDLNCDGACAFGLQCYEDDVLQLQLGDGSYCTITHTDAVTTEPGLVLYPNPTRGWCHVQLPPAWSQTPVPEIQLWDHTGRFVTQLPLQDDGIDLSGFAAGIYLIRIVDPVGSYVDTKVVKL